MKTELMVTCNDGMEPAGGGMHLLFRFMTLEEEELPPVISPAVQPSSRVAGCLRPSVG